MKIKYVAAERRITMDGITHENCWVTISNHPTYGLFYLLEWFGAHGYVRYEKGPPLALRDMNLVNDCVAEWNAKGEGDAA